MGIEQDIQAAKGHADRAAKNSAECLKVIGHGIGNGIGNGATIANRLDDIARAVRQPTGALADMIEATGRQVESLAGSVDECRAVLAEMLEVNSKAGEQLAGAFGEALKPVVRSIDVTGQSIVDLETEVSRRLNNITAAQANLGHNVSELREKVVSAANERAAILDAIQLQSTEARGEGVAIARRQNEATRAAGGLKALAIVNLIWTIGLTAAVAVGVGLAFNGG